MKPGRKRRLAKKAARAKAKRQAWTRQRVLAKEAALMLAPIGGRFYTRPAITGRVSSSAPNLQNVSRETARMVEFKVDHPETLQIWDEDTQPDYSQLERRTAASGR